MSYLLNNVRYSKIIELGLEGIELALANLPPTGPSPVIQDYMHLPEFVDILNKTKNIQQVQNLHPKSLVDFTEEKQRSILTALISGADIHKALKLSRVKEKTYNVWRALHEKGIEPFESFIYECEMAEAVRDMEIINTLRKGGSRYAEALWKILHPQPIVNKNVSEVTVNQEVIVNNTVSIQGKTPAEKREFMAEWLPKFIEEGEIIEVVDEEKSS